MLLISMLRSPRRCTGWGDHTLWRPCG